LPKLQRVIWRVVPSAGNRRALMERGDADISIDLPPKDVSEMIAGGKVKVVGSPIENAIQYFEMNVKMAPFDKVKVRQAIALCDPLPENHGRRDARARQAHVRPDRTVDRHRLAAAEPVHDRSREGEATAPRGGGW
jgi:ABC-type transport system substrate-binding protein